MQHIPLVTDGGRIYQKIVKGVFVVLNTKKKVVFLLKFTYYQKRPHVVILTVRSKRHLKTLIRLVVLNHSKYAAMLLEIKMPVASMPR